MTARTIRATLRGAAWLALGAAGLVGTLATVAPAAEPIPKFITNRVSHASGTTAVLDGVVTPNGIATSYAFEYGPNAAPPPALFPNKTKPVAVPLPTAPATMVKVGQTATGLLAGYHYRIVGFYKDQKGVEKVVYGGEKTFTNTSSKSLKFALSKERGEQITTVYGGSAELTGGLTGPGNGKHALTLQQTPYPFTAPFSALAGTVLTSLSGTFTFKLAHFAQSTEFRFVTVDPRPIISRPVTVHVTPRITVHVVRGGRTGLYRIYGTVAPARNGAAVTIQQLVPQKATSKKEGPRAHTVGGTVLKHRTSKLSRFSVIVKLSGSFRYRVFVRLPKGPIESGHSSNILIKAPGTGSTTKK